VLSFRILGPLEIVTETRVLRPRGSKQNTLLMTLLANPCQLVSTEALIIELWGDNHPVSVENDLHAHVSRLRRRLAAIEPGAIGSRVVTHVSGYELVIRDEELDAAGFVKGLEELRGAARTDPAELVRRLRRLLALWRGRAFGSHGHGPLLQAASARYEEYRIAAYQLLFDHELRNGNYAEIIPEVRGLLARYEFHEQFWQQLMVALYRSGRQADALNVYRELKHRLSDQLGLDPSPTMREYEQAVLDHRPSINRNLQVSYAET
jgi:SARP family transcriptional regulator, regulator of embCAB operon